MKQSSKLIFYFILVLTFICFTQEHHANQHVFEGTESLKPNPNKRLYSRKMKLSKYDSTFVLDSIITIKYNVETKHIYSYNTNMKLIKDLTQLRKNNKWVDSKKIDYDYDITGNKLSSFKSSWRFGRENHFALHTYTYNIDGNITYKLYKSWQTDGSINNSSRHFYTYDSSGNKISEIQHIRKKGKWFNSKRYIYSYDSKGNMLSHIIEYKKDNIWFRRIEEIYEYNNDGKKTISITKKFKNNELKNSNRRHQSYDSLGYNKLVFNEKWKKGSWLKTYQTVYKINSNGKETSFVNQVWKNYQWMNVHKGTYKYDNNGNEILDQRYVWINKEWVKNSETYIETDTDTTENRILFSREYWEKGKLSSSISRTSVYNSDGDIVSFSIKSSPEHSRSETHKSMFAYDLYGNIISYKKQVNTVEEIRSNSNRKSPPELEFTDSFGSTFTFDNLSEIKFYYSKYKQ